MSADAPKRMSRKKKILTVVGVFLLLMLILVASIPALLGTSAARNYVLKRISESTPYDIGVDDWSISWISGTKVKGITVKGPEVDVYIKTVDTTAGVISMLHNDLGTIAVDGLSVAVETRAAQVAAPLAGQDASVARTSPANGSEKPGGPAVAGQARKPSGVKASSTQACQIPEDLDFTLTINSAFVSVKSGDDVFAYTNIESKIECRGVKNPVTFKFTAQEAGGPGTVDVGTVINADTDWLDVSKAGIDCDLEIASFNLAGVSSALASIPDIPTFSGMLNVSGHVSKRGNDQLTVKANLHVGDMMLRGGPLGTDRPEFKRIAVDVDIDKRDGSIAVKNIDVTAPFLALTASGRLTGLDLNNPSGSLSCRGRLDVAAMAGQIPGTMRLNDDIKIRQAALSLSSSADAEGGALTVSFHASLPSVDAVRDGNAIGLTQPLKADGKMVLGHDKWRVENLLLSSSFLNLTGRGGPADFNLDIDGDIGAAAGEVSRFIDIGDLSAKGSISGNARIISIPGGKRRIMLRSGVTNLLVAGLAPSPLRLETLSLSAAATMLESGLSLTDIAVMIGSPVVSGKLAADRLLLPKEGADVTLAGGNAGGTCDLSVLSRMLESIGILTNAPAVAGQLSLDSSFSAKGGKWHVPAQVSIKELTVAQGDVSYEDKDVSLKLDASIDSESMEMSIRDICLSSKLAGIDAKAGIRQVDGSSVLDSAGSVRIDYDALSSIVRAFGLDLYMSGTEKGKFAFKSSLGGGKALIAGMSADTALKVPSAQFMGIVASNAQVSVTASNGIIEAPLKCSVNEGTVDVRPVIREVGDRLVLEIADNSQVISGVKLTDSMASELLTKVHPVLRGSTVVSGDIGLVLEHCNVPLGPAARKEMSVAGRFKMHDVVLTPSGILKDVLDLARVEPSPVSIPEDAFAFEVKDGRIEPAPLVIKTRDVTLTFSGWMDMDGGLHYTVEVPVTERMLKPELFRYVKNVKLKLEIAGTVDRPVLGKKQFTKALNDLVKDVAAEAGGELIKDTGEKLLKEWLKKRK